MSSLLRRLEVVPTIAVTAVNLDLHPEIVPSLQDFDIAIHGHQHVAYSGKSPEQQAGDLDAALSTFRHHGIIPLGFRAPYLRANGTTLDLLRSRGLLYDSSGSWLAIARASGLNSRIARSAEARYGRLDSHAGLTHPSNMIELPVALPDDEILVDGLGIRRPSTLTKIYREMVDGCAETGSMLVVQVHPERFDLFAESVREMVRFATDLGAWNAPLSNLAQWMRHSDNGGQWPQGHRFALAVTGDLDAVCLGDFVGRLGRLRR